MAGREQHGAGVRWRPRRTIALVAIATAIALTAAQRSGPAASTAPQGPRAQGAKVTFERLGRGDDAPHSQRARLLSLAVERGETPTPFLAPGGFRATFVADVTLPARDRMNFRVDGRGRAKLTVNGDVVLDGAMRQRKTLETDKAVRLNKGGNTLELQFDSAAMGDGQVRLFWSGADFGFEPIAPELLSFAADDPDVARGDQLRSGFDLFVQRRCARCHEYPVQRVGESAYRELDIAAADLRQLGARARPAWIERWLLEPRSFRPDATMPRFPLTAAEAHDVATWLAQLGAPMPDDVVDAQRADDGRERFAQLGCIACHVGPDEAGIEAALGDRIQLAFVRQKWHAAALVAYLQEPSRHNPDVRMPDLRVSRDDALVLAAYLLTGEPARGFDPGDADAGRRAVMKHGCAICHALDVPLGDRLWTRFQNLHLDRGCLADEPAEHGAPDHGLSDEQRAALRAFVPFAETAPFRRAPLDFVARHFVADRCYACHALDGQPSAWARVTERRAAAEPVPPEQDPIAQGVPSLTWVGAKLQPSWIEGFVTGKIASPRPWLIARMPVFDRHGAAISQGLVREHGYDSTDEPVRPGDAQLALFGERLVAQGTGFGCVQCHALGDKPATQVFEREGIELIAARGRLRHEYYTRWLADPTRLDPDSRMPKFADAKGRTAFTDVLGGDAAKQFEAIWSYLGSLRASRR